MGDKKIASQVLDYWFAIEFLGQDSFDTITDRFNLDRKWKKFDNSNSFEKSKRKQISVFDRISGEKEIYRIICEKAESGEMQTWGNLTFFVGKIKRQVCIEKLASEFGVHIDQAEKNTEYIPILSFQCNNKGEYIKHSLSLSTIVWALSQVSVSGKSKISDILSEKNYLSSIDELEKQLFNIDSDIKEKDDISDNNENTDAENLTSDDVVFNQDNKKDTPKFSEEAISIDSLKVIFKEIRDRYQKYICENSFEEEIGVKYQLFKNSESKDRYDDDNYMGLSRNFFSSDLKMVKDFIENEKFDFNKDMLSDIVSYICAPHDNLEEKKRYDFVNPKTEEDLFNEFSEILNIKNAPVGKWPSRYMPALMQQVAINFAISNKSRGIFGENGKIFSVNGPPGTGKTTLLKEIIANDIVEKAVFLSQYEKPDEAFVEVRFKNSGLDGGYLKNYPGWYEFKDERIKNYGVLVTSSNNAAVENITAELPMEDGIANNLKANMNADSKDSVEFQDRLNEIRRMFSPDEAEEKIEIYNKDSKCYNEYPEIYFTHYAKNLLGDDKEQAKAWGLVAAPLGRKSNINKFYYDVLNPIFRDFLLSNSTIENRIPRYTKARELFCKQYEKVKEIQSKLIEYGDSVYDAHKATIICEKKEEEREKIEEEVRALMPGVDNDISIKEKCHDIEEEKYREIEAECKELEQRIIPLKQKIKEAKDWEIECRKQASEAENSVSILTKLFRKGKYNAAIELARTYKARAQECFEEAESINSLLEDKKALYDKAVSDKNDKFKKIEDIQKEIEDLKNKREELQKKVIQIKEDVENEKASLKEKQKKRDMVVSKFVSAGEMSTGEILDEDFIKKVLSKDEETSTLAQIANPWSTEKYNLEREKLFYYALKMTKEFVLSSQSCRRNICILGHYWGLKTESGLEKIVFKARDKEDMVGALFNTLFLITPVISSTFASVGRMLRDIKKPGVIGTLIIDEAGQAQPQMAVGALFRSKKAIIVGDPKQVEPVVTDELKLLKESYKEPVYCNYKDKTLSVQSCADILNHFGTFFENGTDYPEWVGCPLIVHRRCVSPMYEISNRISYNGIMKQQTLPPSQEKIERFILKHSQWINVPGSENGNGDHYVSKQGEIVCKLVDKAFDKSEEPSLFIITPFTTVANGIKNDLKKYAEKNKESSLAKSKKMNDWLYSNIGTVHTFQGKEANEVIFMLGCDESIKGGYAVRGFVNSNIVNVAVTRAKYRLYIVGNIKVWRNNQYVREVKNIIDILPIEKIVQIECEEKSEENNVALLNQAYQLPRATSFISGSWENEDGNNEYEIETDDFVVSLDEANFLCKDLSDEQYREFGFDSKASFDKLPIGVKKNLLMAMKLFYAFKPIYAISSDLDASCCGILFCKAMELHLRNNFAEGLKVRFPDFSIRSASRQNINLQEASDNDFMIGTVQYILKNNINEISNYIVNKGKSEYSVLWWDSFNEKLRKFGQERNKCCHSQFFNWTDMRKMIGYEFTEYGSDNSDVIVGGIFHESEVGKKLNN
ncbi:MAG: hypothetical protein K6G88_06010 [Lachnospiraceae bacterium]|nr:hypothetical protein [Lachnospiraceae bacterium]